MYVCEIWSNDSQVRRYRVESRSAMQAARQYGRCELGEVVEVKTIRTGRVLSAVRWTPEDGGKYIRVTV